MELEELRAVVSGKEGEIEAFKSKGMYSHNGVCLHTPHTPRPNSYISFSVADFERLKEKLMQTEQELQNARCVVRRGGADCCMFI